MKTKLSEMQQSILLYVYQISRLEGAFVIPRDLTDYDLLVSWGLLKKNSNNQYEIDVDGKMIVEQILEISAAAYLVYLGGLQMSDDSIFKQKYLKMQKELLSKASKDAN